MFFLMVWSIYSYKRDLCPNKNPETRESYRNQSIKIYLDFINVFFNGLMYLDFLKYNTVYIYLNIEIARTHTYLLYLSFYHLIYIHTLNIY